MNNYIYKVYGAYFNTGYELITKTANEQKARAILQDKTYSKIMMIRYDILQNMDEIVTVVYHNSGRKLKKRKDKK